MTELPVDCFAVPFVRPIGPESIGISINALLLIPPPHPIRREIGLIVGLAEGLFECSPTRGSANIFGTGVPFASNTNRGLGTRGRTTDKLDAVHPAAIVHVVLVYDDVVVSLRILKDLREQRIGARFLRVGRGTLSVNLEFDDARVGSELLVFFLDAELVWMILSPAKRHLDDEVKVVEVDRRWDREMTRDDWVLGVYDRYLQEIIGLEC